MKTKGIFKIICSDKNSYAQTINLFTEKFGKYGMRKRDNQ